MSISYNYFLPTNLYGTLRVTDLGFPGFTAVNANIYCQRNINCDGQLQCGQFHALGTAYFDQVPTCTTNATTTTQLTNYQTVQGLISASGYVNATQAINAVHTSSQPFTVSQSITNTLTLSTAGGASSTIFQHSDSISACILTNTASTGNYRFNLNTAGVSSTVLEMNSTLFKIRATTTELNGFTCINNATFNGNYPTTTLGSNSGLNNAEFATVGYAKSIGGTSILGLNNTFTGTNTFQIPIISSGASLASNSIPAASIVNNSLTNTQVATGFQLVTTNSQTFTGAKTFGSIPILPAGYEFLTTTTQVITGEKQFNANIPTTTLTPSTSTQFSTVGYVSSAISAASLLPLNNTWTGTNAFNTSIPTTTITPTTSTQFATVGYVTSASLLPLNNTWTGTNAFNTSIPTTTLTPSTSTQFSTVGYTTSAISSASLIPLNNIWTGTNTFNTSIPTTTLTPSTSTQFSTVGYTTSAISAASLLPLNNTWTGTNAFNTSIPTTTLTPSTSTQFSTVGYTTSAISAASLLPLNNIWSGTNRFDNDVTFKGQVYIPDQTTTFAANCNINIYGQTLGNFLNWYQNGLTDSVSAGFDIFDQLNYDIYPFSTVSNIICRIGTVANAFKSLVLNGNVKITPQGQISRPLGTIYTLPVSTTFTTIPPYILFNPTSGMGFVLPAPSATNAGQTFVIRKIASGVTVSFTCVGNLPVWVPVNSGPTGNTAVSISTTWQLTILSTGSLYLTIA